MNCRHKLASVLCCVSHNYIKGCSLNIYSGMFLWQRSPCDPTPDQRCYQNLPLTWYFPVSVQYGGRGTELHNILYAIWHMRIQYTLVVHLVELRKKQILTTVKCVGQFKKTLWNIAIYSVKYYYEIKWPLFIDIYSIIDYYLLDFVWTWRSRMNDKAGSAPTN